MSQYNPCVNVSGSGTGAASSTTATLTGVAGLSTYLSGVCIGGLGATGASTVSVTITGAIGGTLTIPVAVPGSATTQVGPVVIFFDPPLKSTGLNTNIVVNVPSFGSGNLASNASAWGYLAL